MDSPFLHWAFFDFSSSTRSAFEAGRWALKHLLLGDAKLLRVEVDPVFGFLRLTGSPLPNGRELFCNISHTEKVAVAALSSSPVGIDIERKDRSAQRVLKKIASKDDLDQLDRFPDYLKQDLEDPALLLWTGKEALSKAIGLGMRKGLKPFKILASQNLPFSAEISVTGPLSLTQPHVWYFEKDDYLISLCSESLPDESRPLLLWEGSD